MLRSLAFIPLILLFWFPQSSPVACTEHHPCSFSTNVPFDSAGQPDSRPGTWGSAAAYTVPIPFLNVPKGYQVRILRFYGDVIAWPHGQIVPGTFAGVLSGLTNTTPDPSGFVPTGLGSGGCFLYVQGTVGQEGLTRPISESHIADGLLNADNILNLKQAVFLNETGVSIHMETTLVIDFSYEPIL
jgi:hypothetical protein